MADECANPGMAPDPAGVAPEGFGTCFVGCWLGQIGSEHEDYVLFSDFLRNSTFAPGFIY